MSMGGMALEELCGCVATRARRYRATPVSIYQDNDGTTEVRPQHRFDEACMAEWLAAHVENYAGPLTVRQFKGGQSNPTFLLTTPHQNYVMRRKPSGPLVAGAHAIEREARVLSAIGPTGFPVPHVRGLCTDDTVIGTSFYVMDKVEGRIFWDATFPDVYRAERPAYFDAMTDTLARLHGVDFDKVGLGDYGRNGDYCRRLVDRWSRQYLANTAAGRDPCMDKLIDWLLQHLPADDETALVHGDFRCDNLIFHPTEPRILAVLDWELSTVGHPLVDFAYYAMMYDLPADIIAGLRNADLAALNIPSREHYIARYCATTGRSGIPNFDYYLVLNLFRLAAIMHGILGRVMLGNSSNAQARERASHFPTLARIAWEKAQTVF